MRSNREGEISWQEEKVVQDGHRSQRYWRLYAPAVIHWHQKQAGGGQPAAELFGRSFQEYRMPRHWSFHWQFGAMAQQQQSKGEKFIKVLFQYVANFILIYHNNHIRHQVAVRTILILKNVNICRVKVFLWTSIESWIHFCQRVM